MVLLLYCSSLPHAASAGLRGDEDHGGLRSTVGLHSPWVPWMHPGSTAPTEWRAVPEHEADLKGRMETTEEMDERSLRDDPSGRFGRQHHDECHASPETRMPCAFVSPAEEFDIEPTVEANGNKPISPLSVAAELPCVSENELQLGRRLSHQTA